MLSFSAHAGKEKVGKVSDGYQLEKFVDVRLPVSEERCGPYFIVASFSNKPERFIFFAYSVGDKVVTDKVSQNKVLVKIDKKFKRPILSSVLIEGPTPHSVDRGTLFKVSPKDYRNCPCLASLEQLK